jgi:hypothetical protein
MNERVYISEIQNELHYKDRRSVRRWCYNNNVRILSDIGSNKQFVLKADYENAKNTNYYKAHEHPNSSEKKSPEYFPRFENEKRMLSILQNITPTL